MKTNTKKVAAVRKSGEQVVQDKLKSANEFLKKADLSIVYKSMTEKQ
ncbi:hypothetical protein [Runella sp.]|jgi:hypothetical protein|nr:hypothetical protein [Runella sp.]